MKKGISKGQIVWYAACAIGGFVGTAYGLNQPTILLLLILGAAISFFGPYQVRRLIRFWKKRQA